jgi:cytochrome c peroxidase
MRFNMWLAAGTLIVGAAGVFADGGGAARAQESGGRSPLACPGYSKCPEVDYSQLLQIDRDARRVDAEVNREEGAAFRRYRQGGLTSLEAERLLGKLVIYDKNLSVNRNIACGTCHSAEAGFTGGISLLNRENVAYGGSVAERSAKRKPMSYAYAPFAPVLHYRARTQDFVGGNFWDMRATGKVTGNPAGDQALGPPLSPEEMGMNDPACVVYRIATGAYAGLFRQVWGADAFDISWPSDVARTCARPLSTHASNPTSLHLGTADRALATRDYDEMGLAAAAFEAGPEVSPFSSKFDAWQDGKAQLSAQEMEGFHLFRGQGQCDQCHAAAGKHPLFTDFTAVNIGSPRNDDLPFLYENKPDPYGYVSNPDGPSFVDNGVGAFLQGSTDPAWNQLAPSFMGTFQVATARNADRRPYASFVKAYTHNGFFKSLKELVHFYNTRDVLARCPTSDPEAPGVGVTCWPAPEQPANMSHQLGNLGLTDAQEDAIVAFLGTLTDGYRPAP